MNDFTANLVATRGNRCTATILGHLEENVYKQYDVPRGAQQHIRRVVLDSINSYKDLVIDIVKSGDDVVNELWAEQLNDIHQAIADLREELYEDAE